MNLQAVCFFCDYILCIFEWFLFDGILTEFSHSLKKKTHILNLYTALPKRTTTNRLWITELFRWEINWVCDSKFQCLKHDHGQRLFGVEAFQTADDYIDNCMERQDGRVNTEGRFKIVDMPVAPSPKLVHQSIISKSMSKSLAMLKWLPWWELVCLLHNKLFI